MKNIDLKSTYAHSHQKRFQKTLSFIKEFLDKDDKILDLGPSNPLSTLMTETGYNVENTKINQDLDLDFEIVKSNNYDVITAFEILEHMVSPFPLLRSIAANKLIVSVPLKLWFTNAYWSEVDPYDRHYHEFEPKQFQMLVNKAGWDIVKEEKWYSTKPKIGFRPILKRFYPRYYIVYCERNNK